MTKITTANTRVIIASLAGLLMTAVAAPAFAQDYQVTVKRAPDMPVETEFASIKKQLSDYCRKQSRKDVRHGTLMSQLTYRQQCTNQLMKDFLAQSNDRRLLAYKDGLVAERRKLAGKTTSKS